MEIFLKIPVIPHVPLTEYALKIFLSNATHKSLMEFNSSTV